MSKHDIERSVTEDLQGRIGTNQEDCPVIVSSTYKLACDGDVTLRPPTLGIICGRPGKSYLSCGTFRSHKDGPWPHSNRNSHR